jgi:hypothetical protein
VLGEVYVVSSAGSVEYNCMVITVALVGAALSLALISMVLEV